ncbi:ROK family protein [Roseimaritima sediminicola]|uniref:ROK family protein n=1 Tax=Roseimaritima sediminicola TaxID=2662066 RepID=UPI0012983B24|nr:ROK family protein [Roseimaritima sediminicola]
MSKANPPEDSVWIGFDLGGTKMMAVVYDHQLQPLGRRRRKTKGAEGAQAGLQRIGSTIEQALKEADVPADRVAGIGIGCPGPVDPTRGRILTAVNLGWDDVPVAEQLGKRFQCPAWVLNDVDAGVYGEYRFGAAKSARCAVGIFPGTGIGGGCVYEDMVLHGKHITCMEIGHTRICSSSRTSGFPLTGTLEAEASRMTIAAEAAKSAFRGDAPHLLKYAGTDLREIRSGALAHAVEKGDKAIKQLIVSTCETIGIGVVNIVHLLAPDTIVLGGGLVEAMEELVVSTVKKTAKQNCLEPYRDSFDVVPAKLGDDAAVLGAAAWAAKKTTEQVAG